MASAITAMKSKDFGSVVSNTLTFLSVTGSFNLVRSEKHFLQLCKVLSKILVFLINYLCHLVLTFSFDWIISFQYVLVNVLETTLAVALDRTSDVISAAGSSFKLRTIGGLSFSLSVLNLLITATVDTSVSEGSRHKTYSTSSRRNSSITQGRERANSFELYSFAMCDGSDVVESPDIFVRPCGATM